MGVTLKSKDDTNMTNKETQNLGVEMETIYLPVTRKTVHFKSASEPGKTYTTKRAGTGKVVCDCPGFMWRQTCRHVVRVASYKG